MNKDKVIKDLKKRNDKLKNQYQLKEIECINNQYKADKYKKEIDKLTAESTEWEERTYCWQDRAENLQIVIDKIKEYCNHKLEMLELQKRNIMQILTPENGYLKADIEIEMQKYKDILELLEEIE